MYCRNCGTKMKDDSKFCPECGTAVDAVPVEREMEKAPVSKKKKSKAVLFASLGIVVVAALVILIYVLHSSDSKGYEEAIADNFKYFREARGEEICKLVFPKEKLEYLLKDDEYSKGIYERYTLQDKAFWESLEERGEVELLYEIKEVESIDKFDKIENPSILFASREAFINWLDSKHGGHGFEADKIKDIYIAEVEYALEINGDNVFEDIFQMAAYKYKGDWYIASDINPYNFLYEEEFVTKYPDVEDAYYEAEKESFKKKTDN